MSAPANQFPGTSPGFAVLSQPPATHWITNQVGAPTAQYIETDSILSINAWSAVANQTITVAVRYLRAADGVLVTDREQVTLNSDGSSVNLTFPLVEGFLIAINIGTNATSFTAAAFVTAQLFKYKGAGSIRETLLLADFVAKNQSVAWPNSRMLRSREGPGRITILNPASPGAGADVSFTVGSGEWVSMQFADLTFTTNATVANRTVVLQILAGGSELFRVPIPGNIVASTTVAVSASQGAGSAAINNNVATLPLPVASPIISLVGTLYTVKTITANIQAGDQWLINNVQAETWLAQV